LPLLGLRLLAVVLVSRADQLLVTVLLKQAERSTARAFGEPS